MRGRYQYLSSILLAVAFLAPALTTGCATEAIVSMTRIETSIIGGTITKEFTTTSGLSRIITMAVTIADSTAISKGHIGSGAITITRIMTAIMTMTMIMTGTRTM